MVAGPTWVQTTVLRPTRTTSELEPELQELLTEDVVLYHAIDEDAYGRNIYPSTGIPIRARVDTHTSGTGIDSLDRMAPLADDQYTLIIDARDDLTLTDRFELSDGTMLYPSSIQHMIDEHGDVHHHVIQCERRERT